MKSKILRNIVIMFSLLFILSGCTSSTAASSWPGYAVEGDAIYISFNNGTYALDGKNGNLIWAFPPEEDRSRQAYAIPAIDDDLVVFGDYAGNLVGLDKEKGTQKWAFAEADGRYIASVLIADEMVFAPNSDHYLYTLDSDGELLWKFKTLIKQVFIP